MTADAENTDAYPVPPSRETVIRRQTDPVGDALWIYHGYNRGHAEPTRDWESGREPSDHTRHVAALRELEACDALRAAALSEQIEAALARMISDAHDQATETGDVAATALGRAQATIRALLTAAAAHPDKAGQ